MEMKKIYQFVISSQEAGKMLVELKWVDGLNGGDAVFLKFKLIG